jgi:hypothetical protein
MRLWIAVLVVLGSVVSASAQSGTEEAVCLRSDVFFCENWEDWAPGQVLGNPGNVNKFKANAWNANPGTPDIVTTEHFLGTKSIRMVTPANQNSGGAIDSNFVGGSRTTIFWRWYTKYSLNYIWSPVGTKHNELFTCCFTGQHGLSGAVQDNGLFSSNGNHGYPPPPLIVYLFARGGTITPGDTDFTMNMNNPPPWGSGSFPVNQWLCLEARVTMNTTATSNDGYIQGWVDGVQRWEYPNVRVVDIPNPASSGFFLASYWNCGGSGQDQCVAPGQVVGNPGDTNDYRHPEIYRYMDNMIGATSRVGCVGTAQQPPGTPSNLQITLNWISRLWAWLGVRPAYAGLK